MFVAICFWFSLKSLILKKVFKIVPFFSISGLFKRATLPGTNSKFGFLFFPVANITVAVECLFQSFYYLVYWMGISANIVKEDYPLFKLLGYFVAALNSKFLFCGLHSGMLIWIDMLHSVISIEVLFY
jgi:hypothetical protein